MTQQGSVEQALGAPGGRRLDKGYLGVSTWLKESVSRRTDNEI